MSKQTAKNLKQGASKPAPKKEPGTSVAKRDDAPKGDLTKFSDQLPDHIKQGQARGNENVGTEDLIIPRLEVVQGLSPAVKEGDPGYVEGARPGHLMNSVTRRLYGKVVFVVPVTYFKQYLVWVDRKLAEAKKIDASQGFRGAFNTMEEAVAKQKAEGGEDKAVVVVETPQHIALCVDPDTQEVEEVMLSMPRSKAKISRQLNTMIKLAGGDRFARAYEVTTVLQKGPKGDFYNFLMTQRGFAPKALYQRAEKLYNDITSGKVRAKMDETGLNQDAGSDDSDM